MSVHPGRESIKLKPVDIVLQLRTANRGETVLVSIESPLKLLS